MYDIDAVRKGFLSDETRRLEAEKLREIDAVIRKGPYTDTWDSLADYPVPEWYRNDKFGIFIHWGVYSVPAFGNEWYPYHMYDKGGKFNLHHVETYGSVSEFGYKDFIQDFTAENYEPEAWIKLFKAAGARFVVPVAEHHDGFAMYKSAFSKWTAAEKGPKRDVIEGLRQAAREGGMTFGVSSHRAEHWFFLGHGMEQESDVMDPEYAEFYGPARPVPEDFNIFDRDDGPDDEYLSDWLVRTCELIDEKHPKLLWFDWWINQQNFEPYLRKLAAYYYNRAAEWGEQVAINYKFTAFKSRSAVLDVERGQLRDISPDIWQNDTSLYRNSWCYVKDLEYKTAADIVADLVDIVSKNGVLLLNVGPKSDGTFGEEDERILREIGAWLGVYGKAVYGTHPWKQFGEGPTELPEGSFTDTQRAPYTSEDIRFTEGEDGALYATVLKWPEDGCVLIRSLASGAGNGKVGFVEVLNGVNAEFVQTEEGLAVNACCILDRGLPVVLKIRFA